MPRSKLEGPPPDWDKLFETAAPQAGYFTLAEAQEAGFSAPLLQYHRGGRIERIARGIYRLRHFPLTPEDDLVPIWLWTNREGVFSHETALAFHGLSDALPATYHLTVPSTWKSRRLRTPPNVTLHYGDISAKETSWHGPVPITVPLRTLDDCAAAHSPPDLLDAARCDALARGLITERDLETRRSREATP